MKQYVAFASLAVLLAGCTAQQSLRNGQPTAMYEGTGAAGDVANCVNTAWSAKPLHLSMIVLYSGTTIELRKTEDGPVVALVDIKPVSDKTIASYYSSLDEDDSFYFDHVQSCMNALPGGN